jgi:putative ABC transport system substrate-binding protein
MVDRRSLVFGAAGLARAAPRSLRAPAILVGLLTLLGVALHAHSVNRLSGLFLFLATWPLAAQGVDAQVGGRVAKIGFLSAAAAPKLCLDVAARLGVRLLPFAIRRAEDSTAVLARIGAESVDGLFVYPDAVTARARPEIVQFAALRRLPAVGGFRIWAESGLLLSYGASLPDMTRRAMVQVDRILREGAKPSDIPIEQPTTFELVVNLKTAKALGLSIPPSLLLRADEVIQ